MQPTDKKYLQNRDIKQHDVKQYDWLTFKKCNDLFDSMGFYWLLSDFWA